MKILRTPDERFANLPGYPFKPNYLTIQTDDGADLRMHYVDEGPRNGPVVLLMHGEPSWSYLYRKMIPVLTGRGLRTIAPDLVGFGRSDKPAERSDYTFKRHVDWMWAFIEKLGITDINLVCQDWGGLIGLRLVGEHPDRFARVAAANTMLPTGDQAVPPAFKTWRDFSQSVPVMPVGVIVKSGCAQPVAPEIIAAYDAPFPDETYKSGARAFPLLVPITPDDPASAANRAAWKVLSTFDKPFLTAFSDGDPITRGADKFMQTAIPGAKGQPHTTIKGGGHFLQEDRGEELAAAVAGFIDRSK